MDFDKILDKIREIDTEKVNIHISNAVKEILVEVVDKYEAEFIKNFLDDVDNITKNKGMYS